MAHIIAGAPDSLSSHSSSVYCFSVRSVSVQCHAASLIPIPLPLPLSHQFALPRSVTLCSHS